MSAIGDALVSIVSGGATGLLGTMLSRVSAFFENKQKFKHELEMIEANAKLQKQESEARVVEIELQGKLKLQNTEVEGEIKKELAATEMMGKSYTEANTRWSTGDSKWLIFVDVVRGMTRPFLTITLCAMSFIIWMQTQNKELEVQIVMTELYLTTAAVLWWFGSRATGKVGRFNG